MIIPLAKLKEFCGATEKHPEFAEPFSFGNWTFAATSYMFVRVPRIQAIEETRFGRIIGRKALGFLKWSWPKTRDADFIAAPEIATDSKVVAIGGRGFQPCFIRLISSLPNARVAIATARRLKAEEREMQEGIAPCPMAFVFGEGEGLKAEGIGLVAPLQTAIAGRVERKATA